MWGKTQETKYLQGVRNMVREALWCRREEHAKYPAWGGECTTVPSPGCICSRDDWQSRGLQPVPSQAQFPFPAPAWRVHCEMRQDVWLLLCWV